jgi:hypothetical protein
MELNEHPNVDDPNDSFVLDSPSGLCVDGLAMVCEESRSIVDVQEWALSFTGRNVTTAELDRWIQRCIEFGEITGNFAASTRTAIRNQVFIDICDCCAELSEAVAVLSLFSGGALTPDRVEVRARMLGVWERLDWESDSDDETELEEPEGK